MTFNSSSAARFVLDTFPWPQFESRSSRRAEAHSKAERENGNAELDQSLLTSAAPVAKIDAVAAAARELRRVRAEALPKLKGGLRALYRTLELPGANPLKDAHAALDTAVLTAYGFSAKKDLLAQLLALNQKVAAKIEKGEPVTVPGVPNNYPEAKKLITGDCIQPGPAGNESAYAAPPVAPTHPSLTPEQAYGDAAHYYSAKEEGPPYSIKK